ncbi:MAG: MFS transporter [Acidimicrobiaceae bacterium]|nr:MFS transporter [Acidimicrobiaceae bacterium]
MTDTLTSRAPSVPEAGPDPRRWLALVFIAISQLMIVVDASIVNIALPSAQQALHITNANRQWVITAYTLAFGGLLLLGGRIADYAGRKRTFVVGLIGFALASAVGGLAPNAGLLFGARALQGAFAALMAPAALSILTVTFTDARERARAFGVYGAIAGGGLAIGLVAGGLLTQYASWRWCLLVNTPIALFAALGATRVIRESRTPGRTRYDLPGVVTSTLGLVALVYGMTKAVSDGWGSGTVIALLVAAGVLLVSFVAIESRSRQPLLPLRVVTERNRGGSFVASLLVGTGLFGMFLFLTYYLQGTLHYSALKTGFAYLPFSAGVIISATLATNLLPRFGPRRLMAVGLAMAAGGLALFTQAGLHSAYVSTVLPPVLLISLGMGMVFVALTSTALVGVAPGDSGVASAMVNTTQQVGGSIGTALLNTIAASATASYIRSHGAASVAAGTMHGYTLAFATSAGLLGLAVLLVLLLVRAGAADLPAEEQAMAVA